ncbi:MAG: hypothetical protein AAGE52_07990 [Myxococcota bacterium]
MSIRVGDQISVQTTQSRITPAPASDRFREALAQGANGLLAGVEQAAGLVPGGSAVTAAVRGAAGGAGGGGASPAATGSSAPAQGGGMEAALRDNASQTLQLLELQQQMAMEQRQFTTVSNVMKARHDTAKSVINNVR